MGEVTMSAPSPGVVGFRELVEIGRGGFSTVYRAVQNGLERPVALKVVEYAGPDARRFEREALALGALSHVRHVVPALHVTTTTDGRPVIVMPLFAESLATRIRRIGPCSYDEVVRWVTQLGAALDEAHRRGVAHRDIKPENVLLSSEGDAYLADFGIAGLEAMVSGTTTAFALSPMHAPPERFIGSTESDVAGDVYSLASTIYAALSGRAPFGDSSDAGGPLGMMSRVVNEPVPPIPLVLDEVNWVLAVGMAKNPSDRPPSAGALSAQIERVLTGSATIRRASFSGSDLNTEPTAPRPSESAKRTLRKASYVADRSAASTDSLGKASMFRNRMALRGGIAFVVGGVSGPLVALVRSEVVESTWPALLPLIIVLSFAMWRDGQRGADSFCAAGVSITSLALSAWLYLAVIAFLPLALGPGILWWLVWRWSLRRRGDVPAIRLRSWVATGFVVVALAVLGGGATYIGNAYAATIVTFASYGGFLGLSLGIPRLVRTRLAWMMAGLLGGAVGGGIVIVCDAFVRDVDALWQTRDYGYGHVVYWLIPRWILILVFGLLGLSVGLAQSWTDRR